MHIQPAPGRLVNGPARGPYGHGRDLRARDSAQGGFSSNCTPHGPTGIIHREAPKKGVFKARSSSGLGRPAVEAVLGRLLRRRRAG